MPTIHGMTAENLTTFLSFENHRVIAYSIS